MSSGQAKHALSHAAIYLVARGVPGIVAFVSIPLFTRLLSPAEYGRYALVLAGANLLNALLFQWLRLSLVRYLPAFKDNVGRLKSTLGTMALLMIAALGVTSVAILFLPLGTDWRAAIVPGFIFLAVQSIFDLCNEYSRAALQPWRYMILQAARSASTVLLGAALVWAGMSWRGPVFGTVIGMALAIAWVWKKDWADARPTLDGEVLAKVSRYGIPLSITVALAVVIGSSDRFLIARFRGEQSAGLYSVAYDFTSQTLTLLMMVIQLAMFPVAVRAFEHEGKAAAQGQMRVNASLLLALGLPCVVGLTLLSGGICNSFLGRDYRAAASQIMPLIALGAFLGGFKAYHFDAAFQFAHRTSHQVWIVLVAAALNVGLNLMFIPLWGINGSAVASVLAYVASISMTISVGRRYFELPFPWKSAIQVALATVLMALMLWPMHGVRSTPAVAAAVAMGMAVYVTGLFFANFMDMRHVAVSKVIALWRKAFASSRNRVDASGRDRDQCDPQTNPDPALAGG